MDKHKTQIPEHGNDRKAVERAMKLFDAMTDDATAPELCSRMNEWFTDPSGWDAKGEALEEYMHSTLAPAPAPDKHTLRSKEEFLRRLGIIPEIPAAPVVATFKHRARPLYHRAYFRMAAVAAILIAMVLGAFLDDMFHDGLFRGVVENIIADNGTVQPEIVVVKTVEGIQKEINLADGTTVWVNEESNVKYRDGERRLAMQGKVWFDVAHDATSPFVVNTERLEILVHGTEFSVEQLENSTVVRLIDGLLDVKLPSGKEARLYSGRQATLVWGTDELLVEPFGDVQDWRTDHIFINGKTVPEILRMTDNFYDTDIHFEESDFPENEEYSINLNKRQSLENVLQVLSIISNGFTFHRQSDGSVTIICVK